jgi:N-acyl-D-amino-acid deacylase
MATPQRFDLLIKNGRIVDGTGGVWYRGDVAVKDGLIAAMGTISGTAKEVMDAHDHVICPGFVDILCIVPIAAIGQPLNEPRIRQGVTTIHTGLCGNSVVPLTEQTADSIRRYLTPIYGEFEGVDWNWRTVADYLKRITGHSAINVTTCFGITNLWVAAVGWEDRRATPAELEHMKEMAAQAMADGATGFSTGTYAPTDWSSHEECVEIAKVTATYGGVYFSHARTIPGSDPFAGFKEAIAVGEEAGIPVHLEHFKAFKASMYHHADEMLALVDRARARGIDVTMDSYPYLAGSGSFWPPSWAQVGGPDAMMARLKDPAARKRIADELDAWPAADWEQFYIADAKQESWRWCEGKRIVDAAASVGKTPGNFVCDFMLENQLNVQHVNHAGCEEDVRKIMQHPAHMVSSDSIQVGRKAHPRTYGNYAKYLGRYVRELGILRLEECVRMMTSAPARRLGLMDRGILRPGMAADIVVFDPDTIIDKSTFEDPIQYAVGVENVVVNGAAVLRDGEPTGALPGRGLKRLSRL